MNDTIHIPFVEHLGVEILEKANGRAVVELTLRPELLNSWHVAHGGVTMTLLDLALSMALRSTDSHECSAMTVEMKVNFIAPGQDRLIAEGRVLHKGRSLSVCEGEVRNPAGGLLAKAIGTFKLIRNK